MYIFIYIYSYDDVLFGSSLPVGFLGFLSRLVSSESRGITSRCP